MSEHVDYNERFRDEMERLNEQRGKRGVRYAPPNGLYVVTLVGFVDKTIKDNDTNKPCTLLTPRYKVVEVLEVVGEEDFDEDKVVDREFSGDSICTAVKKAFTCDDAFRLALAIDGVEAETFGDACETCKTEAEDEKSALIEVRVSRKKSKDGTKEYTNTYINGAHETEEEEEDSD